MQRLFPQIVCEIIVLKSKKPVVHGVGDVPVRPILARRWLKNVKLAAERPIWGGVDGQFSKHCVYLPQCDLRPGFGAKCNEVAKKQVWSWYCAGFGPM